MRTLKVDIVNIIAYALFLALFKIYFIPEIIRQIFKVVVILFTIFFLIKNLHTKKIFNISLTLTVWIIITGLINYMGNGYTLKSFLDSILYALSFYCIYTFSIYCGYNNKIDCLIISLYKITKIYCLLTIVSVLMVGTNNNSNSAVYFFGNKFSSSYFFILLSSLYCASHDMRNRKNKKKLFIILIFTIVFSTYLKCATVTVATAVMLCIYVMPKKIRIFLFSPKAVVVELLLSGGLVIGMDSFLKINIINKIVVNLFNKSYTISGRLLIYDKYLWVLLKNKWFIGYGYNNGKMLMLTKGIFSNTQNGLFEIILNFGVLGMLVFLYTIYYTLNKAKKTDQYYAINILICSMIIAAVFEVSLNWFFLLGISLIRAFEFRNED